MSSLNVEALLAALAADAPCGSDLEYDPSFIALEDAARGKPEQQYGDTVIAAEEPDWRKVYQLSTELMGRTKDLRVALHLLRADLNLNGLPALPAGLQLISGLIVNFWDHVHPMLDVEDNNDPTMRMNALAPLTDPMAVLADVRRATLGGGRQGLSGRDIELSGGKVQARDGESAPSAEGVVQALQDAESRHAGLLEQFRGIQATLADLDRFLSDRVSTASPDFKPLRQLTQALVDAAARAAGGDEPAAEDAAGDDDASPNRTGGAGNTGASTPGTIRNREDAIRMLDRVCDWISQYEPTNPAPLLIRRAQRLMSKSFIEIIRDLAPDGISQIEKIAGAIEE